MNEEADERLNKLGDLIALGPRTIIGTHEEITAYITALMTLVPQVVGDLKNARVPTETHCPMCKTLHVDQDDWAHKIPHRKHQCASCHHIWQPYTVGTVGVDFHVTCRDRRDELLAMVAKLSQTVPLESEVAEALNQRGALLAEIGTLKATIAEHEIHFEDALWTQQFLDGVLAGIHPHLAGPFQAGPVPNTVDGIVGAVRTMREAMDFSGEIQSATSERNKLLVLMIAELQKTLKEVCEIATTPLPEDRLCVRRAYAVANKKLPPP
jgi:hypothetical protein